MKPEVIKDIANEAIYQLEYYKKQYVITKNLTK